MATLAADWFSRYLGGDDGGPRGLHPLTGAAEDYDALLERAGRRRFVLLGEASHGTHEVHRGHAAITSG